MGLITYDKRKGEFNAFSQVRDYYIWVQSWLDAKGHEIRWVKGALYLVDDLADGFEEGVTSADAFVSDDVETMLRELNLGIADYAITQFYELLDGKYRNKKLVGDEAYQFDLGFVTHEQGVIAYPIYLKYEGSETLKKMNDAFNNKGMTGFKRMLGYNPIPVFKEFKVNLADVNSRFGQQGRIDVPMTMLWLDKHHSKIIALERAFHDEEYAQIPRYYDIFDYFRSVHNALLTIRWK